MATGGDLDKLLPRHLAACRMRVEGLNNDQIAEALGVSKRTLEKWFGMRIMKDEIARLQKSVEEQFVERLAGGAMVAIEGLVGMVQKQSTDPTISDTLKLEAMRELLDRASIHTARVRERQQPKDGGGGDNYLQVFQNLSDGQLAEFIKGWNAGALPAIEGTTAD